MPFSLVLKHVQTLMHVDRVGRHERLQDSPTGREIMNVQGQPDVVEFINIPLRTFKHTETAQTFEISCSCVVITLSSGHDFDMNSMLMHMPCFIRKTKKGAANKRTTCCNQHVSGGGATLGMKDEAGLTHNARAGPARNTPSPHLALLPRPSSNRHVEATQGNFAAKRRCVACVNNYVLLAPQTCTKAA